MNWAAIIIMSSVFVLGGWYQNEARRTEAPTPHVRGKAFADPSTEDKTADTTVQAPTGPTGDQSRVGDVVLADEAGTSTFKGTQVETQQTMDFGESDSEENGADESV